MIDVMARLFDVADGQAGFLTLAQADDRNVPASMIQQIVKAGLGEFVVPGVVRLRAGGRHPFPRLYATWLLLEPHRPAWERPLPAAGVVSGRSALRLHRVGDLPGESMEFSAPDPSVLSAGPNVMLTQAVIGPEDWTEVSGLPVTRPGRTLADIAASSGVDITDVSQLAAAFLRTGVADKHELADRLDEYIRRHGLADDGPSWLTSLLAATDENPTVARGA